MRSMMYRPPACRTMGWRVVAVLGACAIALALAIATHRAVAGTAAATTQPQGKSATAAADNSRCLRCHAHFKDELMSKRHGMQGVGCIKCHGESERHASDEESITPPDTMYAKEEITELCTKCHQPAELRAAEKNMDTPNHTTILVGRSTDDGKTYCLDCHGKHALEARTRRWDKSTGVLLTDDGGGKAKK